MAKKRGRREMTKVSVGRRMVKVSPRHKEVWRLVSLGCSVKEAAAILDVAPSTVDNHKSVLMAKLGCDKVALLARLAIQCGISGMDDRLTAEEQRLSGREADGWN